MNYIYRIIVYFNVIKKVMLSVSITLNMCPEKKILSFYREVHYSDSVTVTASLRQVS